MQCHSLESTRPMGWRCHDCFGNPVFCTHCIQKCHQVHPFHRVSRWNGTCFTPSTLSNAGLTLNLGHSGSLCPVYHKLMRATQNHAIDPTGAQATPLKGDMTELSNTSSADAILLSGDPSSGFQTPVGPVASFPSDQFPQMIGSLPVLNSQHSNPSTLYQPDSPAHPDPGFSSRSLQRFWEVTGSVPYEMTTPVPLRADVGPTKAQEGSQSLESGAIDLAEDPFFANDSEEEETWKKVEAGGLPLKVKHDNRKYDKLNCPILVVVDTTGIHELRVRFCQCKPLKNNPLQAQLMNIGLYASSMTRTRTVFTFRALHHFDITNLEGKTTAWQYYSTLKRLTSNVFADTVPDRYRELMRALRQWRDLSSRRRAGHPLDPSVQLKPGDLALFCPACPQPGINLRDDWHEDKDQLV